MLFLGVCEAAHRHTLSRLFYFVYLLFVDVLSLFRVSFESEVVPSAGDDIRIQVLPARTRYMVQSCHAFPVLCAAPRLSRRSAFHPLCWLPRQIASAPDCRNNSELNPGGGQVMPAGGGGGEGFDGAVTATPTTMRTASPRRPFRRSGSFTQDGDGNNGDGNGNCNGLARGSGSSSSNSSRGRPPARSPRAPSLSEWAADHPQQGGGPLPPRGATGGGGGGARQPSSSASAAAAAATAAMAAMNAMKSPTRGGSPVNSAASGGGGGGGSSNSVRERQQKLNRLVKLLGQDRRKEIEDQIAQLEAAASAAGVADGVDFGGAGSGNGPDGGGGNGGAGSTAPTSLASSPMVGGGAGSNMSSGSLGSTFTAGCSGRRWSVEPGIGGFGSGMVNNGGGGGRYSGAAGGGGGSFGNSSGFVCGGGGAMVKGGKMPKFPYKKRLREGLDVAYQSESLGLLYDPFVPPLAL